MVVGSADEGTAKAAVAMAGANSTAHSPADLLNTAFRRMVSLSEGRQLHCVLSINCVCGGIRTEIRNHRSHRRITPRSSFRLLAKSTRIWHRT
jgi:hypothetical protein